MDPDGDLDGELKHEESQKKDSKNSTVNSVKLAIAPKNQLPPKLVNPGQGAIPPALPKLLEGRNKFVPEKIPPGKLPEVKVPSSPEFSTPQEKIEETKGPEKVPQNILPSNNRIPSNLANPSQVVPHPIAYPVQKHQNKDPQKAVLKFARFLSSRINPIKYKIGYSNDALNNLLQPDSCPTLRCLKCRNIFVGLPLKCSHNICLYCFHYSLQKYISNPSPKTFQKFACHECSINCCMIDVMKACSSMDNSYMMYEKVNFRKKCMLCGNDCSIPTDFFGELECLHLCRNCYAEDLMFGGTNCPCCSMIYTNKQATMNRPAKCTKCLSEGRFVNDVLRACHNDHILCFSCLEDSVIAKQCVVCNFDLSESLRLLKNMLRKKCCLCRKTTSISELFTRPCCSFFQCLECSGDTPKCKTCNITSEN